MDPDNDTREIKHNLLVQLARAWNHLDAELLDPLLSPNMVYSSQWLDYTITGAHNYISYLTEKFAAIRTTGTKTVTRAQMATLPKTSSNAQDCILLTQIAGSEIRQLLFFIQTQNSMIIHIYAGDPAYYPQLELSGIYP
ncbi:MAG: hypothetical protein ACOC31_06675 [Bacteroidota bacterium]